MPGPIPGTSSPHTGGLAPTTFKSEVGGIVGSNVSLSLQLLAPLTDSRSHNWHFPDYVKLRRSGRVRFGFRARPFRTERQSTQNLVQDQLLHPCTWPWVILRYRHLRPSHLHLENNSLDVLKVAGA